MRWEEADRRRGKYKRKVSIQDTDSLYMVMFIHRRRSDRSRYANMWPKSQMRLQMVRKWIRDNGYELVEK